MQKQSLGLAFALAILLGVSSAGSVVSAQDKKPSTPAAAAAFDPHDLSGVWMDDHPRPNKADERYWIYKFTPDEPPMTEWGKAQFAKAKTSFGPHAVPLSESNDPNYNTCVPIGFPRIFLYPLPMQIIQAPGQVILLFEYDSIRHQIYTDGRKHDETLGPLWMGDSIGHWEGDTLVADTVNLNDKTWLDRMGHAHSDQLHVTERIRRVDHDHLVDDLTIEDPKAYTHPWTAHLMFVLKPKWTLAEVFCEDEQSFESLDEAAAAPKK